MNAFMNRLGERITGLVGTMWCAAAFTCLALMSLPDAIRAGRMAMIQWTAQTFLQLVLLSIILVGQNVQAQRTEKRDIETHDVVMASHADLLAEHTDHKARLEALQKGLDSLRALANNSLEPRYVDNGTEESR